MNQEVIENLESIADGYLDVIVTMNYKYVQEEHIKVELALFHKIYGITN